MGIFFLFLFFIIFFFQLFLYSNLFYSPKENTPWMIAGFVAAKETVKELYNREPGDYIIRFGKTQPGCLVFVVCDLTIDGKKVLSIINYYFLILF